MWVPNRTAVLDSWSEQVLVGAALQVLMYGLLILKFLFGKPNFLFPFAAVCSTWVFQVMLTAIVTLRYFVFVSSARIWPCMGIYGLSSSWLF